MTLALSDRLRSRSIAALLAAAVAVAVAGCGGGGQGASTTQAQQGAGQPGQESGGGQGRASVDWPYFGRIPERTHFFPNAPNPPFRFEWVFWAHQLLEFPPAVVGRSMYVVNKAGTVFGVGTTSGKARWQHNLGDTVSGPAYAHGLVFVAQSGGTFVALDARSGDLRWTFHAGSRLESSPLVVDDKVYFGSDGGTLFALDDRSGKVAWKRDLGAPVKASPSFHDGVVYVGDYKGRIHALAAGDGKPRWSYDARSAGFYSSPSIAFGRLYEASSNGTLFALTLAGRPAWHFEASNDIYSSPAVADVPGAGPTVFVGSYNHQFYALDAKTGAKRWSHDVGGQVPGTPTVVGKTVYTSSFQTSKTIGLDARSGRPRWQWGSAGYTPVISTGPQVFLVGFQTIWAFENCRPQGVDTKASGGTAPVCQRASDLHLLDVRRRLKQEEPRPAAARGPHAASTGGKGS